jgi:hypothetical protein
MVMIDADKDGRTLIRRPVKDIHADLKTALKRFGLYDSLDYFEIAIAKKRTENVLFPQFEWLSCSPVSGKAGGHYIYVGAVSKNRHNLIFVGKTSKGFQAACDVANRCAQELRA